MQIQLKQAEIVTALKQYIASQGISLYRKDVNISFTAGRKEAGVLADISIEDASPVVETYGDPADVPVTQTTAPAEVVVPVAAPAVAVAVEAVAAVAEEGDEPPFATATEASGAKVTSLFS